MNKNTVQDIRNKFAEKLKNEDFVIDKNGGKVLEIIGANFIADNESIFGEPNKDYIEREIAWYSSKSRNVYDIPGKVPAIWKMVADQHGNINSNYGWAIYSEENGSQYTSVIRKLKQDKLTRQAIMIYNRPSMHIDWIGTGTGQDFMCCQNMQYMIRDNKLHCVVNFRSNDARFGYLNDYAWAVHVLHNVYNDISSSYEDLEIGEITWNASSLHVYERDFNLVEAI